MTAVIFFVFGIVFGSFLNVCIHRFPREESVVLPRSKCPECSKLIAWHDNIPLVSYILLRGKCRHCKARIRLRYFAVELLSGLIWVFFGSLYGVTLTAFTGIFLFSVLLALSATDFETGYIPDKLTLPSMAVGLAASALLPGLHGQIVWYWGLLDSLAGLLFGGGILLLTGIIGNLVFKKESMGGGDIKLMAMLGAFLGMQKVLLVFLLSPIVALPLALYVKIRHKAETIPFGPFIAITGAWIFLQGDEVWNFLFRV